MSQPRKTLLSQSAQGATFLIGLQVGSRALTFLVNQILLRFLSPRLLGVSNQLDLFAITVLTFARESLRIALGRQGGLSASTKHLKDISTAQNTRLSDTDASTQDSRRMAFNDAIKIQEAINLAFFAPALGPVLATIFGSLYLNRLSQDALDIPYIRSAVYIFAVSAVAELLAEPCFAAAARIGLFGVRARAETLATVARCVVACLMSLWASQSDRDIGALPFAAGQACFAVTLNVVYWSGVIRQQRQHDFVLWPISFYSDRWNGFGRLDAAKYVSFRFSKPILLLTGTLYGQSVLKHFLTQGDTFLVSFLASLSSQGIYALASNYGSLLARMLFQPIEESSRGVFGSLLGAATTTSYPPLKPRKENLEAARTYLQTILHLYALLSLGIVSVGPRLAPQMLRLIAGQKWADSMAGDVLSAYCYYLPLLAFNGMLEAFVAATATPSQLRIQAFWMGGFFMTFAAAGFISLHIYDMGATGLVIANAINMIVRILWSASYLLRYFEKQTMAFHVVDILPRAEVIGSAIVTGISLEWLRQNATHGKFIGLIQSGLVAGIFAVTLLFLERNYFRKCLQLLRPVGDVRAHGSKKER